MNDLWKLDFAASAWTRVAATGSDNMNQAGSYQTSYTSGTKGVPGARSGMCVTKFRNSDEYLLYGGYGYTDSTAAKGFTSDFWLFDMSLERFKWWWQQCESSGACTMSSKLLNEAYYLDKNWKFVWFFFCGFSKLFFVAREWYKRMFSP